MLAYVLWSFPPCFVWDVLRPSPVLLRTLYASLPSFRVQLDFYAYYTQKFALTRPLHDMRVFEFWRSPPSYKLNTLFLQFVEKARRIGNPGGTATSNSAGSAVAAARRKRGAGVTEKNKWDFEDKNGTPRGRQESAARCSEWKKDKSTGGLALRKPTIFSFNTLCLPRIVFIRTLL